MSTTKPARTLAGQPEMGTRARALWDLHSVAAAAMGSPHLVPRLHRKTAALIECKSGAALRLATKGVTLAAEYRAPGQTDWTPIDATILVALSEGGMSW